MIVFLKGSHSNLKFRQCLPLKVNLVPLVQADNPLKYQPWDSFVNTKKRIGKASGKRGMRGGGVIFCGGLALGDSPRQTHEPLFPGGVPGG